MLGNRDAVDRRAAAVLFRRPLLEIDRARERRQQHELREGEIGLFGERDRRVECLSRIARQAEDERAEHVDPVAAEDAQPRDELVAEEVESFVDVFQAFLRDRLDTDERPANARVAHRLEERRILRRFHRNLRVKDQIVRQLRQLRLQGEPFGAKVLQLVEPRLIGAPPGLRQVL